MKIEFEAEKAETWLLDMVKILDYRHFDHNQYKSNARYYLTLDLGGEE